ALRGDEFLLTLGDPGDAIRMPGLLGGDGRGQLLDRLHAERLLGLDAPLGLLVGGHFPTGFGHFRVDAAGGLLAGGDHRLQLAVPLDERGLPLPLGQIGPGGVELAGEFGDVRLRRGRGGLERVEPGRHRRHLGRRLLRHALG
ncbi:MAG: hypothetical protein ACK55I_38885, partial [bacterium]